MIRYKLYRSENPMCNKKWYARAVITQTYDEDKLAEHMAKHNTPYSKGVIKGILTDAISCIKELVLDGKAVKLTDLAIFSAGLRTEGAKTPSEFTVKGNVRDIRLRARATGDLRTSQLNLEATVKEIEEYSTTVTIRTGGRDDDRADGE